MMDLGFVILHGREELLAVASVYRYAGISIEDPFYLN
jgi:hypothetical protein